MNTYTWHVTSIATLPEVDGKKDVVVQVKFFVTGTDNVNSWSLSSSQGITLNDQESFVDYESLTESRIIGWIKDALGESGQYTLTKEIDTVLEQKQRQPVTLESKPLPWKLAK